MTATEFLQSKQVPFTGLDDAGIRNVARAYGWAAPKAHASIVPYTPTQSKKGPGLYLKVEIAGTKDSFQRLCDGDTLTDDARAVLAALANDLADSI